MSVGGYIGGQAGDWEAGGWVDRSAGKAWWVTCYWVAVSGVGGEWVTCYLVVVGGK